MSVGRSVGLSVFSNLFSDKENCSFSRVVSLQMTNVNDETMWNNDERGRILCVQLRSNYLPHSNSETR